MTAQSRLHSKQSITATNSRKLKFRKGQGLHKNTQLMNKCLLNTCQSLLGSKLACLSLHT